MVIEYTLASSARKFVSRGNVAFPLVRAFMDDLNLMSSSVSGPQNNLDRCVKAFSWSCMYFRADKSRNIVIVRGKSMNTTPFYVTELSTPSVPVKFLRQIINGSLADQNSVDELQ